MIMTAEGATERESLSLESLQVQNWRLHRLTDMGLMLGDARTLADSGADLHQMLALLKDGCPVEMLRRIVL